MDPEKEGESQLDEQTNPVKNKPSWHVDSVSTEHPGKRVPQSHAKPYQSPLWKHLETIRTLRRKRQTWAAIALHLKESHGLATTSTTVFKFFKRAAIGRVPFGFDDPRPGATDAVRTSSPFPGSALHPESNEDPLLVQTCGNDPFANLRKKYERTRRPN